MTSTTGTVPDDGLAPDEDPPDEERRPRSRLRRRVLTVLLALVLVALIGTVAGGFYLQSRLSGQVTRIDGAFEGLENRPTKPKSANAADGREPLNVLVMGTDRRSDVATTGSDAPDVAWLPGEQRTDVIMLLHVDADREGASLVSIPRDSWVDVPGYGQAKINAAFSWAGPSLAVETVERLIDVRVDHLAVIDWTGFAALTDSVGGVDVTVPETVEDTLNDVVWKEGRHHLDGEEALLYVRQRYGLPGGDFDRVRRQQAFVRALVLATSGTVSGKNPRAIYDVLDNITRNVSVDEEWSVGEMRSLLLDMRDLGPDELGLVTVPTTGTGYEGEQSVVYLDRPAGRALWKAVRADKVEAWLDANRDQVLTGDPR